MQGTVVDVEGGLVSHGRVVTVTVLSLNTLVLTASVIQYCASCNALFEAIRLAYELAFYTCT